MLERTAEEITEELIGGEYEEEAAHMVLLLLAAEQDDRFPTWSSAARILLGKAIFWRSVEVFHHSRTITAPTMEHLKEAIEQDYPEVANKVRAAINELAKEL